MRSRNADPLDGVLPVIRQGSTPPAPPGTPVLEIAAAGSSSAPAAIVVTIAMVISVLIDPSTAIWILPLWALSTGYVVRGRQSGDRPKVELRTDGLVVRELLFGGELWVPWEAVSDVELNPQVENAVNLEVPNLAKTTMDASVKRILESAYLAMFGRGVISVTAPSDMPPAEFVRLLDRRILDTARRDSGLLGAGDHENTI